MSRNGWPSPPKRPRLASRRPTWALEAEAERVALTEDQYILTCGPMEIAEVQAGGGFWTAPSPISATVGKWLLAGRSAPVIP
jgi:hypothetical protein